MACTTWHSMTESTNQQMRDWLAESNLVVQLRYRWLQIALNRIERVETVADKIRYASNVQIEAGYVRDLLELFDTESGELK